MLRRYKSKNIKTPLSEKENGVKEILRDYSSRKNSMNGVLYLVIPLQISSTRPP